jgi:hypothetical protein
VLELLNEREPERERVFVLVLEAEAEGIERVFEAEAIGKEFVNEAIAIGSVKLLSKADIAVARARKVRGEVNCILKGYQLDTVCRLRCEN